MRPSNIDRKMAKNTIFSPKFAIFLFYGLYSELLGDEKRNIIFPGDLGLLCFQKNVNVPKRAVFSIFHSFDILNPILIFH